MTTADPRGYHNYHLRDGWSLGVHKAPEGAGNPWLVVFRNLTIGARTREMAETIWKRGY